MAERSIEEFLADLDRQAAQDDEDEQTLLTAGAVGAAGAVVAKAAKAVVGAARTVVERVPTQVITQSPKFCRQCGAELKPEWRFCTKCGATVSRT